MKKLLISFLLMAMSMSAFSNDFKDSLAEVKKAEHKHGFFNHKREDLGLSDKAIEKLSSEQIVKLYAIQQRNQGDSSEKHVIVPIVMFSCLALVIALALFLNYKKAESRNYLLYKSLEKGTPIPLELFRQNTLNKPSDLKRGIILLSVGIGLTLALYIMNKHWAFGFIPVSAGIGYLLVAALDKKVKEQNNE